MRVLLDECLPRRLKRALSGHDVQTVPETGWAGKENGELLQLAAAAFDVFVTIDQNMRYQQNLAGASVAVIVLMSRSNRFEDLLPIVPSLLEALRSGLQRGQIVRIGAK